MKTQFIKDTIDGGRAKLILAFHPKLPNYKTLQHLINNLDKQGYEIQGNLIKFYQPNNHVNDVTIDVAKQTLHLAGYERYDYLFPDDPESTWNALNNPESL